MSCYHPLTAYRAPPGTQFSTPKGLSSITFNRSSLSMEGVTEISLPCGKCIGCRLDYSRQWAMRICHEQYFSEKSCFVTLTYDDDHLPEGRTLVKKDLQDFFKRLRRSFRDSDIRYFACGEYGGKTQRPHYHVAFFGIDFSDDRKFYKFSGVQKNALYISKALEKCWKNGFAPIGTLSFDSAAYVSRYILKKVTGKIADEYYQGRLPEFVLMSRKPGLGHDWYDRFGEQAMLLDSVILKSGLKAKPPRYYEKLFNLEHHNELSAIKERRIAKIADKVKSGEYSPDRLSAKENVTRYVIDNFLKRNVENVV